MIYIMLNIVSYVLLYALIIAAFGTIIFTFRGRINFIYGVIATTGALLLSTVIRIYISNKVSGVNVITLQIDEAFVMLNKAINSLSPQQMKQMFGFASVENMDAIKSVYTIMFPSILILNTLLLSYAIYMLVKHILALFKKDVSMYPKFSELKLRRSATIMLGVSYILPLFLSNATYSAAISNITLIISGVAFACGFSFVDFKMRRKLRSAWFRLLVYIALFFLMAAGMTLVMFTLVFIAIADSFFDFRSLQRKEVKGDGQ